MASDKLPALTLQPSLLGVGNIARPEASRRPSDKCPLLHGGTRFRPPFGLHDSTMRRASRRAISRSDGHNDDNLRAKMERHGVISVFFALFDERQ